MAGALRKTMVYLGLAEDDARYETYDVDAEFADDDREIDHDVEPEVVRERGRDLEYAQPAPVTPITRGRVLGTVPRQELHRISTIHPRTYNEAKTIGEAFRAGTPVIMNLTDLDDSDAKRLVDFAAGLVFGLHGSIERVTSKVFLLSPSHGEVAPAEKVKVPERTFFNQS